MSSKKIIVVGIILASALIVTLGWQPTTAAVRKVVNLALLYKGINDGLVGYWTFDGPDVSGTTATDRGSGGNNGTISGSVVRPGVVGQSLSFDGSDDFVSLSGSGVLNIPDNITISAWVMPRTSKQARIVSHWGDTTGEHQWLLEVLVQGSGVKGQFARSNGTGGANYRIAEGTTELPLNQWVHLVGRWDGTNSHVFVNGSQDGANTTGALAGGSMTHGVRIGHEGDGSGSLFFDGLIDEVRVYNRALTAAEITYLFSRGAPEQRSKQNVSQVGRLNNGLVGYWTFDGPQVSGTTATDSSGNGNTGTLNGPTVAPGAVGQALSFDGADDYVGMGDAFSLGTSDLTAIAWVKVKNKNVSGVIFAEGCAFNTGQYGFQIRHLSDSGGSYQIAVLTPDGNINHSLGALNENQWEMVALRRSGNTWRGFVNGSAAGSDQTLTGSVTLAGSAFEVGRRGGCGDNFANAFIDEVRVYNRALSNAEVAEIYRAGAPTERSMANVGGRVVNPSGLKAYLAFDGPSVSGTTVTDLSNNGNNGLLINGATVDIGIVGQSLKCDGVNDYLTINDANVVGNTVTTTFWVKSTGKNGNDWSRIVSKTGAATNSPGWELMVNSTGPAIRVRIATSANAVQDFYANGEELDGRWHHIALTISGGTLELFRDGVSAGAQTYTEGTGIANSGAALRLCVRTENVNDARFEGQIDEFRLYDRILSAGEIKQLYDATKRE